MKKTLIFFIVTFVLFSLAACNISTDSFVSDSTSEAQMDHSDDFADSISVEVDSSVLKTCEKFAESLGYETGNFQKAVLLSNKWIEYVVCDDDLKAELIDAKDIVVIFENIRCVVDSEKEIVLGRIPYV